jgi:2-aminoadipate transaminase
MPLPDISFAIDRESEEPIYRQLIRQIQMQVESGQIPAGTRLPASRELARKIDVSRISVVNAYAELRAEGYLSAHAGRGTFVSREVNPATRPVSQNGTPTSHSTLPDQSLADLMRLARRPSVINFWQGTPPPEFFSVQSLRDAINTVLDRDGARALAYEMTEGYGPLRAAVRDYVSGMGIETRPENVLITGGAQQGIDLIVQSLVREGETIVTSDPTYLGIISIARARRIHLHGIPVDQDGMRTDMLENYLMENQPRLIYIMPTFLNPSGQSLPLHRRRQVINLAAEYNVPVLEDAVNHELRFQGEPLPPLKALDSEDMVIHVSAFSKMLMPALRVGYVITNSGHFERLMHMKHAADVSSSALNQRAVHIMLQRGVIAQHLERNNRELLRRRDAAVRAAEQFMPPGSTWNVPDGGLHMWITLPKHGPTSTELFIAAIQNQVAFTLGNMFYLNGGGSYEMRISFALQAPDRIEEGFRRIGRAWRNLANDYDELEETPLI